MCGLDDCGHGPRNFYMARITKIKAVKMTQLAKGSPNGIRVLLYPEGAVYDVPSGPMSVDLAENFIKGGQAVEVKEETPLVPPDTTKNEPAAPDNKDAAKQKGEDKKDSGRKR